MTIQNTPDADGSNTRERCRLSRRRVQRSIGSDYDYATVAYDATGTELWVDRYTGQGTRSDVAAAIGVDPLGNIYVTGVSQGDYATLGYDASGTRLWVAQYHEDFFNAARALAIDAAGHVYVTGVSQSDGFGGSARYVTVAYEASGSELWVARYYGWPSK